jgi:hypothetical protein
MLKSGKAVYIKIHNYNFFIIVLGARGNVVVKALTLQTGRSRVRVPMRWIFSNLPNPSGRTMALRSTEPLTEMNTRNLYKKKRLGVKCGQRVGLTNLLPSISCLSK